MKREGSFRMRREGSQSKINSILLSPPEVTGPFTFIRGFELFYKSMFWHSQDYQQGEPLFEQRGKLE